MESKLTPIDASKSIEEKLTAASGKPLLVQRDANCSGHASIKIASDDDAAHILRYKPEFESELPYLSAFQCDLASTSAMGIVGLRLQLMMAWIKSIFSEAPSSR
jgi:hypothetical protein